MTADVGFPPGLFGPPPDPEMQKRAEELHQFQHKIEAALRLAMRRFAFLTCSCRPWFDWSNREPAQVGCIIHGALVMDHDGRVL